MRAFQNKLYCQWQEYNMYCSCIFLALLSNFCFSQFHDKEFIFEGIMPACFLHVDLLTLVQSVCRHNKRPVSGVPHLAGEVSAGAAVVEGLHRAGGALVPLQAAVRRGQRAENLPPALE